ncbi:hypothetical protein PY650_26475 [Rhizobium calliandrae]|uniref:Uncharacterized protein n=1 Tax=Rhizobium calliandrae TaxID=1312182 RepID=A0ABT7KPD5_9HYPH|nr:hypothetical protein [Rhizobium calliandrae]MDL2409118.1 hypothetical protein [Rhizobium calliandrae]
MLHSIVCPSMGHSIIHHFAEGAAVWGQVITPSVAHLIQSQRELPIDFSRVRPGIVFEAETGVAMLPHVIDATALRLHVGADAFFHAAGRSGAAIEAVARIVVGGDCTLKVWGRATAEDPLRQKQLRARDKASTIPVIFNVTFWEISRASDGSFDQLRRASAEKDREIHRLRSQVALAMCSQ